MKTRNDIYELIEQLNVTMDTLEREYNVDQGGCFLTSWVIAKNLYERKIDYRVVVYAYPESTTRDVRTLVRNEQICHMCIQTYKMEIGGVDDDLVNEHGLKKIITNLTPEELQELWETGEFNEDGFSKKDVEHVIDEIEMTFNMVW